MMEDRSSYVGRRYGLLTVTENVGRVLYGRNWQSFLRCRCDCGRETTVPASALLQGNTRSCGCMLPSGKHREMAQEARRKLKERIEREKAYAFAKVAEAEAAGQTFTPRSRLVFIRKAVLLARENGELDRSAYEEEKRAEAEAAETWEPGRPARLSFENEHADDWMFGGVHVMATHPPFGASRKRRKSTQPNLK